ncbi:hypothetical protein [Sodalis-like endosymbiont of Proechinophthirus fluctus]|nr:hypothetical protein [Sodalis-like endosymbiont of Proechinophthirus fluctus]
MGIIAGAFITLGFLLDIHVISSLLPGGDTSIFLGNALGAASLSL